MSTYRTADFVATIGVNTHINFGGSPVWSSIPLLNSSLAYLGINHLRDNIPQDSGGAQPLSTYEALMNGGMRFDFVITDQVFGGSNPFAAKLSVLDQLVTASPGGVATIEGFNEPVNWPLTFNGVTSPQSALDAQKAWYAAVKADPALKNIPVYDLSAGHWYDPTLFQNASGRADYENIHVYPQSGTTPNTAPPGAAFSSELAAEYTAPSPRVITEFGYYTQTDSDGMSAVPSGWTGTTNALQGRLIVDGLLDAYRSGFSATYIYDLFDAYQTTAADDYLGLFNYDGSPKTAATALHNLTTLLKDQGTTASSFSPGSLSYTLSGTVAADNTLVMQKSDGSYWIALWDETAAKHQVSLSLGSPAASIKVYDPLSGTSALQTVTNANAISVSLGADPLLVQVRPGAPVTPTPTPDTVTLRMSEDAYKGDAQFTVTVDGEPVGGTLTAHALHASGDSQLVTLSGIWGQGQHTVGVSFTNDLAGGSPAADRNLYVDAIAYDGVTAQKTMSALHTNETLAFQVRGSVPTLLPPADTLTLHLAEDAYQGDAQFALLIDGKAISTPQSVTALRSSGLFQDFSFSGNFGAGPHTVGVQFTNDAYAGTTATDRNLYVTLPALKDLASCG